MNTNSATGRNDPCPCGSGKKFKQCCGQLAAQNASTDLQRASTLTDSTMNSLVSLFHAGKYVELEQRARDLAVQFPDVGFVWKVLGLALQQQEKEALNTLHEAARLLPGDAEAHSNLGVALLASGQFEEAIMCFCRALVVSPAFAAARGNLQKALSDLHKQVQTGQGIAEIEAILRRVLFAYRNVAEVQFHLALLWHETNRLMEAEIGYQRVLDLQPDHVDAHNNLGNLLKQMGRMIEAEAEYRHALKLNPKHADASYNLANLLKETDRFAEAEQAYRNALVTAPDMHEASLNLANLLQETQRLDEAEIILAQLLAHNASNATAHFNLANLYLMSGRFDEAQASYLRALEIAPDYADLRLHYAFLLLQTGDFARGWQEFENRWHIKSKPARPDFSKPLWLGDADLNGKSILLYAEWGLGDTLQFVRYASVVAAMGATVYMLAPASLTLLLANCEGVRGVFAEGDVLPPFDYHCPLMSLPLACNTTLESIPGHVPYLAASDETVARWREKLGRKDALRIGLTWAGGSHREIPAARIVDQQRSMHFKQLLPLLDVPGVEFYSLQVGAEAVAQCYGNEQVIDFSATLFDFQETAALIENLDLVICVDTAVAHLAGGLGKPVWLLNRYNNCWRWLIDRDDSPWYPGMRIFRQPDLGNWGSVVADVRAALMQLTSGALPQ